MDAVIFAFVVLFTCLFLTVPISASVGMAALSLWWYVPRLATNPAYLFQAIVTTLDSYALLAVPLFILSGQIMARGGIASRMFDFMTYFLGRYKGGLPCAIVATCMFYGACTGAGPAVVAAVGAMAIPFLVKLKYDKVFVTALVAVAGGLGAIIPPSIGMVFYSVITGASVGNMFLAGILPGILIGASLMIYVVFYCHRKGEARDKIDAAVDALKAKGFLKVFKDSFLALLTPFIILGGIYSGLFTPTEAAGVSVFYGLIVSCFIYKTLPFKMLPRTLYASLHSVGPQIYIAGCCTTLARALTLIRASQVITDYMVSTFDSTFAILLAINVFLLFCGMFMDIISSILITTPLLWPIAQASGIHVLHFGIIMICNLCIGYVTPPVGANLNNAFALTGISFLKIARAAVPMVISFFLALMMITYVPAVSLTIPLWGR